MSMRAAKMKLQEDLRGVMEQEAKLDDEVKALLQVMESGSLLAL